MKSFPSTMDAGGSRLQMQYASTSLLKQVVKSFKDAFKQAWNAGVTAALLDHRRLCITVKIAADIGIYG